MNYKYVAIFALLVSLIHHGIAYSVCNCGSTDASTPCTGQAISVTVVAETPNGGTAVNQVYNWEFNSGGGDARCGQFANGDYWVAPAAGQSTVTITDISSASHTTLIKADADPTTEEMGLLSAYGNYTVAENIIPSLPISYSGINSIVAAIERNTAVEGPCEHSPEYCIDSINVVTVLATVPALAGAETIRPNITGESKELLDFDDFDFSRISEKSYLIGTNTAGLEAIRHRWAHNTEILSIHTSDPQATAQGFYIEAGVPFRAHSLVDDYGAGWSTSLTNDIVTILSDDNPFVDEKAAIASILSFGLDIYHAIYDGPAGYTRSWASGAGQHTGKFTAPAFLAALMKDPTKANVMADDVGHAHDYYYSGPQEVTQHTVGPNGAMYGDYGDTEGGYWNEMLKSQCFNGGTYESNSIPTCPYVTGQRTGRDPYGYIDGVGMVAGGGYTEIGLAGQRNLVGLMYLMPEICEVVNTDSLPLFVKRYLTDGVSADNDPCVGPDTRENPTTCNAYTNTGCVYYSVTWGPDPENPGDCIKIPTPPYTQVGRFTSKNGVAITPTVAYSSTQIVNNWSTIAANSSCRIFGLRLDSSGQTLLSGSGTMTLQ